MRGFLSFFWRSIQSNPFQTWGGLALTGIGIGWPDIAAGLPNLPPYLTNRLAQVLIVTAGVMIIAYAFYLQSNHEREDSESVRRLRSKPHVTFGEISDAIAKSGSAYQEIDVLHHLMKAMWWGEFETLGGYSRTYITLWGEDRKANPERMLYSRVQLLQPGTGLPSGQKEPYEGYTWEQAEQRDKNLFAAVARHPPSDFLPSYIDAYVKQITLSPTDFARWYRRFRDGRYER